MILFIIVNTTVSTIMIVLFSLSLSPSTYIRIHYSLCKYSLTSIFIKTLCIKLGMCYYKHTYSMYAWYIMEHRYGMYGIAQFKLDYTRVRQLHVSTCF